MTFIFRPQIAELAGNHPHDGEDTDTQVDSDLLSTNISDFAQWVQQERFPLFVKVLFNVPFLERNSSLFHNKNEDKQ